MNSLKGASTMHKCRGEYEKNVCPKRNNCHRFLAEDSPVWQPYFNVPPFLNWNNHCEFYWPEELKPY